MTLMAVQEETQLLVPAREYNENGKPRRVGVEIEFAGLSTLDAARIVAKKFDGRIQEHDAFRYEIDTAIGTFIAELDLQYAHKKQDASDRSIVPEALEKLGLDPNQMIGELSEGIAPCEIVSPPLLVESLVDFDALVTTLAEKGAEGTEASLMYAFGLHLNPEVSETSAEYILGILRAYMLLSDWLRETVQKDLTRAILPFSQSFPANYIELVLDPGYKPDRYTLIRDYLTFNNTRNRELDCLPLFAHLDRKQVMDVVSDDRVKPRPTFHYRLPDARLSETPELVLREWDRWLTVERLAENTTIMNAMSDAYRENRDRLISNKWAAETEKWLNYL